MSPMQIPMDSISFHPMSFCDHNGRVFFWNEKLYRAITPLGAIRCKELFKRRAVSRLVEKGLLVGTEMTNLRLGGYSMVLQHQRVPFVSYPFEWPFGMLKDAALLVADLEMELIPEGLTNLDSNPWNVLFDGTRPVYIDFSSMLSDPAHDGSVWPGLDEFTRTFLYPLHLMSKGHDHIARWLLHDRDNGVEHDDFVAISDTGPSFGTARRALRRVLEKEKKSVRSLLRPILKGSHLLNHARKMIKNGQSKRLGLVRRMRAQVERIREPVPDAAESAPSHDGSNHTADQSSARIHAFETALKELRPGSILHISRDEKWLSRLAAGTGSNTLVFQTEPSETERLYRLARAENLRLLPLVMDFRYPSAGAGLGQRELSSAADRLKCDVVVAAGIIPELVFERGLAFEQMSAAIAAFAISHALIEFAPMEVSMPAHRYANEQWRKQFAWYTLDNLIASLRNHFRRVDCFADYEPSTVLLRCEK